MYSELINNLVLRGRSTSIFCGIINSLVQQSAYQGCCSMLLLRCSYHTKCISSVFNSTVLVLLNNIYIIQSYSTLPAPEYPQNITFPPSTDGVKHSFSASSHQLCISQKFFYIIQTPQTSIHLLTTLFPGVWKLSSVFSPSFIFFFNQPVSHMALSLLLCQESQQPWYIPQQGHLRYTQHTDSSPLNSHKTIIEKLSRLETLPATKKGLAFNNISN